MHRTHHKTYCMKWNSELVVDIKLLFKQKYSTQLHFSNKDYTFIAFWRNTVIFLCSFFFFLPLKQLSLCFRKHRIAFQHDPSHLLSESDFRIMITRKITASH